MGTFGYNFLSKIIRNDAFRQDPEEVYNWRVFALASAVSAHSQRSNSLVERIRYQQDRERS